MLSESKVLGVLLVWGSVPGLNVYSPDGGDSKLETTADPYSL